MPARSVGTLLVQSSLGVWEMPGKRRRSDCPRFLCSKPKIQSYKPEIPIIGYFAN